ncbi:MAG: hypothetical protein AB7E79_14000 [Rhodospirillaceae bacterium]
MSESPEIPANPQLSPGFDKARRLSRILVFFLSAGFVLGVIAILCFTVYMASPELQAFIAGISKHPIGKIGLATYVFGVLSSIPVFLALFYARRLFQRFADGDVFSLPTIGLMRTAAMWITIAGIVPPRPLTLVIGMATYVAAYVMAEARRLADDSASIV